MSDPVQVIDVPTYVFDAEVLRQSASGCMPPPRLTPYMSLPAATVNVTVKPVGVPVTPRSSGPAGSADRPSTMVRLRAGNASTSSPDGGLASKPSRPQADTARSRHARIAADEVLSIAAPSAVL